MECSSMHKLCKDNGKLKPAERAAMAGVVIVKVLDRLSRDGASHENARMLQSVCIKTMTHTTITIIHHLKKMN